MISDENLEDISHLFCGDYGDLFIYKSGPRLVKFFNQYYQVGDVYKQGFPSRWAYVFDKLKQLIDSDTFDTFLNIVLSKEYIISEQKLSAVGALEKSKEILDAFNNILISDQYKIIKKNEKYYLIQENDDLIFVGSGGFANVYKQKSTGLIVKKLKDDFLMDKSIRSRFKREFNIMKSLKGTFGIINVFTFSERDYSYTMEVAEMTLANYIKNNDLTEKNKIICIQQVLYIMKKVHERDIIHRDISDNNIFINSGMLKIADFGLGKDLNMFTSHQTLHTNAMGQYFYCAPEQFMMLKDGDKRSDVYSLGRIINFIMTGDPRNAHHHFRSVCEKATNSDAAYRYADAGQLLLFFEKAVKYNRQSENQKFIDTKIEKKIVDEEIENYIYNLSGEEICSKMIEMNSFCDVLTMFMEKDDSHGEFVIQSIEKNYKNICGRSYEKYDIFSSFAKNVILEKYSFVIKEIAANILGYIAWDVNRFSAQHMVEDVIKTGVEPMIEDVIREY